MLCRWAGAHDSTVLCSHYALPATAAYTTPMKLYDYLAAGLPVLAPDQRAVQEVLGQTLSAIQLGM